jgi:hypothetical protein
VGGGDDQRAEQRVAGLYDEAAGLRDGEDSGWFGDGLGRLAHSSAAELLKAFRRKVGLTSPNRSRFS